MLIENGRAIGVEYRKGGELRRVHADAEVLVAAGTYNTAKLLMLSGLGPADHLRAHGIEVALDLPGVGQNLQDHHEVPVIVAARAAAAISGRIAAGAWCATGCNICLFKTGPAATTGVEACAFFDPDGGERPTIQLYCVPTVYLDRDVKDARRPTASR